MLKRHPNRSCPLCIGCKKLHAPAEVRNQKGTALLRRQCVFVVDDDPSMRMGMKRLLRQHGFEATLFESASALLGHGDFDSACCVILDINLNGESGVALRRRLADNGVWLPVIYITGNDSEASRAAAIESGCIAYLTKPFPAQALIESIESVGRPTIT